jgi:predicted transcriptional regulator of viral defense system
VSHASALVFHDLSDVSPSKVHITINPTHRIRRSTPRHLVVHYEPLPHEDVTVINGVPVTTPVRAIRDAIADHLGPALIHQAIEDGRRRGGLLEREAAMLRAEMDSAARAAPVRRGSVR